MYLIHRKHHYSPTTPQTHRKIDDYIRHPKESGALEGMPIEFQTRGAAAICVCLLQSCQYCGDSGELSPPTLSVVEMPEFAIPL